MAAGRSRPSQPDHLRHRPDQRPEPRGHLRPLRRRRRPLVVVVTVGDHPPCCSPIRASRDPHLRPLAGGRGSWSVARSEGCADRVIGAAIDFIDPPLVARFQLRRHRDHRGGVAGLALLLLTPEARCRARVSPPTARGFRPRQAEGTRLDSWLGAGALGRSLAPGGRPDRGRCRGGRRAAAVRAKAESPAAAASACSVAEPQRRGDRQARAPPPSGSPSRTGTCSCPWTSRPGSSSIRPAAIAGITLVELLARDAGGTGNPRRPPPGPRHVRADVPVAGAGRAHRAPEAVRGAHDGP